MVPWTHPSLHPTLHIDWFSRFLLQLTGQSYFTMGRAMSRTPKTAPTPGGSGPNTWFLGPTTDFIHAACRSGQPFFCSAQDSLTLQWGGPCPVPPKLPLPLRDPGQIHGSLGPPESTTQTTSQSVHPFLQGSPLCPTDRQTQTDRQTWTPRHINSKRPHFCTTCTQCSLIITTHTHNCLTAFDPGLPG